MPMDIDERFIILIPITHDYDTKQDIRVISILMSILMAIDMNLYAKTAEYVLYN